MGFRVRSLETMNKREYETFGWEFFASINLTFSKKPLLLIETVPLGLCLRSNPSFSAGLGLDYDSCA